MKPRCTMNGPTKWVYRGDWWTVHAHVNPGYSRVTAYDVSGRNWKHVSTITTQNWSDLPQAYSNTILALAEWRHG